MHRARAAGDGGQAHEREPLPGVRRDEGHRPGREPAHAARLLLQDVHPAPAPVAALREGPAARRRARQAAEEAGGAGVADRVPPPPRRRSGDRRRHRGHGGRAASRRAGRRCRSRRRRTRAGRGGARQPVGRRRRGACREGSRRRSGGSRAGGRARLVRRARPRLVRQHPAPDPGRRLHNRDRLDRAAVDVRGQRPAGSDAVFRRRAARVALRSPAGQTRRGRDHDRPGTGVGARSARPRRCDRGGRGRSPGWGRRGPGGAFGARGHRAAARDRARPGIRAGRR